MGVHILCYLLFTICKLCKEEEGTSTGLHRNKFIHQYKINVCIIKTHSSVSVAKKTIDAWHTSVLFTSTIKLPNSAFHITKTKLISTKFIYIYIYIYIYIFCLTYTPLHIPKLKEIALAFLEILIPENCPIFFTLIFLK